MTTTPSYEHLELSADGGVATVTLNRPNSRNALSPSLISELTAVFNMLRQEQAIRVIVLNGSGRSFCVGFDLMAMSRLFTSPNGPDEDAIRNTATAGRHLIDAILNARAVTIAQIHGHAVGGGFLLAAACDLCVAAENVVMSIPEIDVGLPLLWGGVPLAFRQLGPAFAKDLILTGRQFSPPEISATGFPQNIVDETELASSTQILVENLLAKPAPALLAIKKQFRAVIGRAEVDDVSLFKETALHPAFMANALTYIQGLGRKSGDRRLR